MTRAARYTLVLALLFAAFVALATGGVGLTTINRGWVQMSGVIMVECGFMGVCFLLRPTARMLATWRQERHTVSDYAPCATAEDGEE